VSPQTQLVLDILQRCGHFVASPVLAHQVRPFTQYTVRHAHRLCNSV
jgi:hypothetical protein